MSRLIDQPAVRERLLAAIAVVPAGVRISIPQLRDHLLCQGDVIAGIEWLMAAGALDRGTLRPPACSAADPVTGADLAAALDHHCEYHGLARHRVSTHLFGSGGCIGNLRATRRPRPRTIARVRAFLAAAPSDEFRARSAGGPRVPDAGGVTGAELAAKLDALVAEHGLSRKAVGIHLVGQASGIATIRHSNPRRKTVERILVFLDDPPLAELKPRDAWTTRRANQQRNNRGASGVEGAVANAPADGLPMVPSARERRTPDTAAPTSHMVPLTFEEQLARVERGEVGIAPNIRIGRPDPGGTLGGVTGEINL